MKLADCVEYLSRGKSPNYVDRSEITVINQACIYWDGINSSKVKYHNPNSIYKKAVLQNGDVLITSTGTGTLGRAAVYYDSGEIVIADSHVTIIRTDKNKLLPEFLCLYLRRDTTQKELYAKCVSGSTNQIELSKDKLLSFPVPEIPIEVQHTIVANLGKLSHIITIRNKELSALDDLIKARFVEMFGDPDVNPMSWPEKLLSEMLDVLGGYAFKSDGFSETDGIPVLRIGNINAGFFKPVNMVFWEEDENLNRYIMYPGDLVMSLTGTVGKDDYGNVCILGSEYAKYYLNQRNAKLELKQELEKHYLSQLMRFEKIKKRLTGISRGVRQANISNKDILNLKIPVPPIELQQQFASFVARIDKSKAVIQKSLDETQLLFDSLMQKYFG